METTSLSSKGQVILPKSVREAHRWMPGTRFIVEDAVDGVLLRPIAPFPASTLDEVIGCAGYAGPAKTLEEMEAAIAEGARTRHGRG